MKEGFVKGLIYSFMAVLPMFIGYLILGSFNRELTVMQVVLGIFFAGFFKEVIFRGFLYGQLFRYAGWGFIPAALPVALCFGYMHLYQGDNFMEALSAFGVTAVGSIFFSWVYTETHFKLWSNIGLHTFMNMAWVLFPMGGVGAVGNTVSNVLRICTVLIAIGWIIIYKRRHHLPLIINRHTLWTHRSL